MIPIADCVPGPPNGCGSHKWASDIASLIISDDTTVSSVILIQYSLSFADN